MKRYKILISIVILITLTFTNVKSQVKLDSGLIGYWPFSGNSNDHSGNNNHGTVNRASLTSDRFGNLNSAYEFIGVNNWIELSKALPDMSNSTFSVWTYFKGDTNVRFIFSDNSPSIGNDYYFTMNNTSIGIRADKSGADLFKNKLVNNYAVSKLNLSNSWHNIIWVMKLTASYIYLDGKLVATINETGSNIGWHASKPSIGRFWHDPISDCFYKGMLDDIRIYKRALDSNEVFALYNEGICQNIESVTDTLIINWNRTGFKPLTYQNSIKIYPNPTKNNLNINYGDYNSMKGYTLKITNSLGQEMYKSAIIKQTTSIDLNSWSGNGLYLVQILDTNNNIIDVKKIVLK